MLKKLLGGLLGDDKRKSDTRVTKQNPSGRERRDSVRYPANRRVRVYFNQPQRKFDLTGRVADISKTGMKFMADDLIDVDYVKADTRGEIRIKSGAVIGFKVVRTGTKRGQINCRFDNEVAKFMIMEFLNGGE